MLTPKTIWRRFIASLTYDETRAFMEAEARFWAMCKERDEAE